MVVIFEQKSNERGWIELFPFEGIESLERIKIGHSYFWFLVYEDRHFEKYADKEYRLKKIAAYKQTTFFFE